MEPGLQSPILFTQEHTHHCLAFSDATGGQVCLKSGHRGTSKVWQEEGGQFTKWGFITVLSRVYKTSLAHGYRQRSLGCRWVMLFLLAPTGLADTTDYARGCQEQQGGSHQGNNAQAHKNPNHLCSVPHH